MKGSSISAHEPFKGSCPCGSLVRIYPCFLAVAHTATLRPPEWDWSCVENVKDQPEERGKGGGKS